MNDTKCPPFLEPRLRLFLSADIVGSTSLKQVRLKTSYDGSDIEQGPKWFSAIQGFYFEASQAFLTEWSKRAESSADKDRLYGEPPRFWKSVGDEVLFTKILTDYQQLVTTLHCWLTAVKRMRVFLKAESPALDVKCTAWTAGFPFFNREVVIGNRNPHSAPIEDYFRASGEMLNTHYENIDSSDVSVDYIGPSIDTGFRLTGHSSSRKMVLSIDAAYLVSMTNFDGELARLDLYYEGAFSLKGVIGGAPYPVFWINMSQADSLAVKEDRLKDQKSCNREDVKEFCDAFYAEYGHFMFKPFIKDDGNQFLSKRPDWYDNYHENLVKNFRKSPTDYSAGDAGDYDSGTETASECDVKDFVSRIVTKTPPKDDGGESPPPPGA